MPSSCTATWARDSRARSRRDSPVGPGQPGEQLAFPATAAENSLGSIWAMGRPPHHSSITAITGAWSDRRSGRILAPAVTGWPVSMSVVASPLA